MFALVLAAAVAAGPTPTPTAAPAPRAFPAEAPPKALESLAVFEGAWTCESVSNEGVPPPVRSRMTIARELDGFWYAGRATDEKSEAEPRPATRLFFWSYDNVLGKFVGGWLDSRGGWSAQTSPDWEDDKLVFLGHVTATGEKVTARETFTRPAQGRFRRRYEILGFIEFQLIREDTCRKQD
jgi:hypothetical protein